MYSHGKEKLASTDGRRDPTSDPVNGKLTSTDGRRDPTSLLFEFGISVIPDPVMKS